MKMGRLEKLFVNSPTHSERVASHAAKMLEYTSIRPGSTYLDVGCGNGVAALQIARSGKVNVTGVDVDPEQVRFAERERGDLSGVRFLVVDGTRLPFADGEFDIVASNKVTHHIPHWEDAFEQMVRVLKVGGFLIYGDLVFPSWLASFGRKLLKEMGFPTDHALSSLAEKSKLTRVHFSRGFMHYEAVWQKPL